MQPSIHPSDANATAQLSISTGETAPRPYASYEIHPAAALFPLMHGVPLGELAADIVENGLREPVVRYQGLVLDGRNRLRACELAKVEPRFVEGDGVGSPLAFVLSRNLHRRHLNESQRAMIAARARELFEEEAAERKAASRFGHPDKTTAAEGEDCEILREITVSANLHSPCGKSSSLAAELLNVSTRSVATASRILRDGDDELISAVDFGAVAVSDAAAVAALPKPKQRQAIERVRSGRSRTLRQAARDEAAEAPREELTSAAPPPAEPTSPTSPTKLLRGECQKLAREVSKLIDRLDALGRSIGGHTLYTDRVRQGLSVSLRAIHEYLTLSGKKAK